MTRDPGCPSHGTCTGGCDLCQCGRCPGHDPFECVNGEDWHCAMHVGECGACADAIDGEGYVA